MKQFIIKLSALTVAIALLGWLVFSFFLQNYYLPILPGLLLFFFVVTLFIHSYQIDLAKKDMGRFTRSIMLTTFFKLILYSIVAIAYIAIAPQNTLVFVICLMFLYLVFTVFEVFEISRISRKKQN